MAKMRFLWNNLTDGTGVVLTSSSAAAEWPLANLATIWPRFYHRTSSLGAPDFWAWDLLAGASIRYAVLWNHNFTAAATAKLQGDNHPNFGSLDHDITLTYGTHWNDDILVYAFPAPSTACRYWRIIVTDAANPDGYVRAGRAFLGNYFEPRYSFAKQSPVFSDPSVVGYSSAGNMNALRREPYAGWSYEFSGVTAADAATFRTMYESVGCHAPFFLVSDRASPLTKTEYVKINGELQFAPMTLDFYAAGISVTQVI
jgi:hypothetical protein